MLVAVVGAALAAVVRVWQTVVMVMLLTTTLVSTVMMVAWDLSLLVVLPFWLFYTAFQGVYFSSTLYKVSTVEPGA